MLKAKRVSSDPPRGWSGTFRWVDVFGGTSRNVDINCPAAQNECRLTGLGSNGVIIFDRGVDLSAVTKGWTNPSQAYAISSPILASGHYFSASPGWKTECTPWPECSAEIDKLWMLSNLGGVPVEPWRNPAAGSWNLGERLDANSPSNTRVRLVLAYRPTSPVGVGLYAVWNLESKERDCLADMRRCASIGIGEGVAKTPKNQDPSKSTSTTEVKSKAQPKISEIGVVIRPIFGEVPVANEFVEIVFAFQCSKSQESSDSIPRVQITFSKDSKTVKLGEGEEVAVFRTSINFRGTYGVVGGLPEGRWKFELTIVDVPGGSCTGDSNPVVMFRSKSFSVLRRVYTDNPWVPDHPGVTSERCPASLILGYRGSGQKPSFFNWLPTDPKERELVRNEPGYSEEQYLQANDKTVSDLLGSTVGRYTQYLRRNLKDKLRVNASDIGFWSVGVDDAHLTTGPSPSINTTYRAVGWGLNTSIDYSENVKQDLMLVARSIDIVTGVLSSCASRRTPVKSLFVVGYSQGSLFARMFAARYISRVSISPLYSLPPLGGVLLIADPLRSSGDRCCVASKGLGLMYVPVSRGAGVAGIDHPFLDSIYEFFVNQNLGTTSEEIASKTPLLSLCTESDSVCHFPNTSNVHSKYYAETETAECVRVQVEVLVNLFKYRAEPPTLERLSKAVKDASKRGITCAEKIVKKM